MDSNLNKTSTGIITEDPVIKCHIGLELKFNPVTIHHNFETSAVWLKDWCSFEGTLIKIHFSNGNSHSVEGSGVIVAPGVALSAFHVVDSKLGEIKAGLIGSICTAITSNGLLIWRISKFTIVPNSDLVILSLSFATNLPPENTFNQIIISTRLPKIGENLLIAGFRSSEIEYKRENGDILSVSGNVLACNGKVTERYPNRRDNFMLRWPTLEINCPSFGGMSGGPVFDSKGLLVGLLCSSIDDGPSYVSLIWPALGIKFAGGWPAEFFENQRTLIDMSPSLCAIDNPKAIEIIDGIEGEDCKINYKIWED